MMTNDYDIAGADKQYAGQANGSYAEIVADIGPDMLAISNNRTAIVFTDNNGDPYKTLQDASGDGVIPVNSILVADANGRATSNAGFLFDAASATQTLPLPFTLNFGGTVDGAKQIVVSSTGFKFQSRVTGAWVDLGEIL
jgi:hypothetical protein